MSYFFKMKDCFDEFVLNEVKSSTYHLDLQVLSQ